MARPTKLSPELQKVICDRLRAGATRTAAVLSANVNYQTFLNWMAWGEASQTEQFLEFFESVTRAEADAECLMAVTIQKAAVSGDWRAAESWLKRRRRDEWGDNVSLDLDREIAELMAKLAGPRQEETPGGTAAGG